MRLDANQGNKDDELIELISVAKKCFAPRYQGEISGYVNYVNNKLHLEFEEYDESDTFRTLITRQATHTFTTYDFALKYYSVTERQADLFRQRGSQINDTWTIDISRRVSFATISAINAIVEQKDAGVDTYLNVSEISLFFSCFFPDVPIQYSIWKILYSLARKKGLQATTQR